MIKGIDERIRAIRKDKGLTMQAFGESIGMSKASISGIESGKNGPSEQTIRLICSVYKVDYFWLKEGKGSMYLDDTDNLVDEIAIEQNLDPDTTRTLKRLLRLSPDSQKIVLKAIDTLLNEKDE
jgi:transcriptional regulator with XRE-family HTH domain|nr:MAG TPA: helix-turn-helix domain protein [Caudoviricetes sp.]DAR03698.1 MAG TPA: helix-turn-helix domain protein [Caudoviricetes sp.]